MKFIILVFVLLSSSLFAQTQSDQVDCSDEAKARLLIRKGAMNKEFCLNFKNDVVRLLITGQLYRLASYSNKKVLQSEGLTCEPKLSTDKSPPPSETISIPSSLTVFENVMKDLIEKIKAYNAEVSDQNQLADKIKVKGIGYADGVRIKMKTFDQAIHQILSSGGASYFKQGVTPDAFKNAACNVDNYVKSFRDKGDKYKDNDYTNILNPTRNVFLARTRAEFLTDLITKNLDKNILYDPEIVGYDSPYLTTGQNLCKGFCTYRRGAELQLTLPGMQKLEQDGPKRELKIPSTIISLKDAGDYSKFSQLALISYLKDIEYFINTNKDNSTVAFKEFLQKTSIAPSYASGKYNIKLNIPIVENNSPLEIKKNIDIKNYYNFDWTESNVVNRYTEKKIGKDARNKIKELNEKYSKKAIRDVEYKFFKNFYKNYSSHELDPEKSPYFHWGRAMFWVTYGGSLVKDNMLYFYPSKFYKQFDSQKTVNVFVPNISFLKEIMRETIRNCSSLLATKKVTQEDCEEFWSYVDDFAPLDTPVDKIILNFDSIYETITKNGKDKNDLINFTNGVLLKEIQDSYDGLVQEEKDRLNSIRTPSETAKKVAKLLNDELWKLKTHPDFQSDFSGGDSVGNKLLAVGPDFNLSNDQLRTSKSGRTTSIYNFIKTNNSQLWALANQPSKYTDKVMRSIGDNELVTGIFVNVDKIATEAPYGAIKVKGFFHTACQTGVIFDMKKPVGDEKGNDKFRYLSRLKVFGGYNPRTDNEYASYDDPYFDTKESTPPTLLMRVKHPTTYVIPNCKSCGCVSKLLDENYKYGEVKEGSYVANYTSSYAYQFEDLLKNKAVALDFSTGYKWQKDPNRTYGGYGKEFKCSQRNFYDDPNYQKNVKDREKKKQARQVAVDKVCAEQKKKYETTKKKYDAKNDPDIPYKEFTAEEILKLVKDKKIPGVNIAKEDKYLNSNYCVLSLVIPQPHEVGVGETEKDTNHETIIADEGDAVACPLVDVLTAKEGDKDKYPDVTGITEAAIDDVYKYCANVTDKIGMAEEACNEDIDQVCYGLSETDKIKYSAECKQKPLEIGDNKNLKNVDFCKKLMEGNINSNENVDVSDQK